MAEQLEVSATLTNHKVRFTGVSKSNPDRPITFDFRPPLGDGHGFAGLELFLLSLAGCSATSVVYLLRKMGKTVSAFTVNATGRKRDRLPMRFERIDLEFHLTSPDAADADLAEAIRQSEDSVCPVWALVKGNVDIATHRRINQS